MFRRFRLVGMAIVTGSIVLTALSGFGSGTSGASAFATKKPAKATPKKAKPTTTTTKKKAVATTASLASFCKASKAWLDWETVTLPTGHIDEKWLNDTIAYYTAVVKSAPKEIKGAAGKVGAALVADRQAMVDAALGRVGVYDGLQILLDSANDYVGPNDSTIAYATQMSDYLAANCGLDFQAPWKALDQPTG